MRTNGIQTFLSPEQVVQRALALTAIHPDDHVCVAGPDSLAAMLSLCRAGFQHVECARQATCLGADDACDLLLVVGPMPPEESAALIRRTTRLVRDGGRIAVQVADAAQQAAVRQALAAAGFGVDFSLIDRAASRMVIHTLSRPVAARRAS
jgi:hypothetical protein